MDGLESMVRYPIGIQSFSEIREGEYVYVDKTRLIYQLVNSGKYYFLSRPRRFGKSLLLSTLKAYFTGRQALFTGLAIDEYEKEWKKYPIIDLSLAAYNPSSQNLNEMLDASLNEFERLYHCDIDINDPSRRLTNIIRAAKEMTGENVVILIDEYDAPIVAHIDDNESQEANKNLLKSVYANLKDMDEYIRFAMLTGVSRFSKMTIFSGLNNLNDISFDSAYSEICGITDAELTSCFQQGVMTLADKITIEYDKALTLLKDNYDGYHFTEDSADIYNPFSLLNALAKSKISPYWFQSGTPTFLVKTIQSMRSSYIELFNEEVTESTISDIDTFTRNPLSLLFQTGYLTIKDYDRETQTYRLGIPNKEVEQGLFAELLAEDADIDRYMLDKRLLIIRKALKNGAPDSALEVMREFFASIPASLTQNKPEVYYENNLYLLLMLIGIDAGTEYWTSNGRIDTVIKTPDYVYVIELKLDGSAEEALRQIDTKEYALQWRNDGRKVFKIGINFSKQTRNIQSWKIIQ